jgi:hypothetical protein
MAPMNLQRRTVLAWGLWLATFGFLAAGLAVTVAVVRPLTLRVLAAGAVDAVTFSLGFATVGLVLTLRRPANPIGWLYAGAGLAGSLTTPLAPRVDQLLAEHRPLPLAAQLNAVVGDLNWVTPIALGVTLPALLLPDGRPRSRRWRLVAAASVTGIVLILVGGSVAPGPLQDLPIDNPFGLGGWPARLPGGSPTPGWRCTGPAWWRRWSVWCCASGPHAGSSVSRCAGSVPAPPVV